MGDSSAQNNGATSLDVNEHVEEQSSITLIKSRDVPLMELNGDNDTESGPLNVCNDKTMINGQTTLIKARKTTMDTREENESVTTETLVNIDINGEVAIVTNTPIIKSEVAVNLVDLSEDIESSVVSEQVSLQADSEICLESSKSDVAQDIQLLSEGIRPNDDLLNYNSASNQIDNETSLLVINTNPPLNGLADTLISKDKSSMSCEDRQIISDISVVGTETQENCNSSNIISSNVDNIPKLSPNVTQNMSDNSMPSSKSVQNSPTNSTKLIHSRELSLEELTDSLLNETEDTLNINELPDKISSASSPVLSIKSSPSPERTEHIYGLNQDSSSRSSPSSLGLNGLSGSILSHPAYKMAMQDLLSFREQVGALKHECDRLEKEKQALEADRSPEIFQLQLETLERTVAQQAQELEFARQEAIKQDDAAVAALASAKIQNDKLKKQYDEANREREATVVRYAVSERELLRVKDEVGGLERRLLEAAREREVLLAKLKTAAAEKSRACHALDVKYAEATSQAREMEKLRDEINSRDIKIKWAQNKIRSEIDNHKETQQKLERMTAKVHESREESEQVRRDCQAMVRSCQQGREDKTQALELQVQEQKAQLITERHARQDAEDARKAALAEAAEIKARHQQLLDENNALCLKVQSLERDRLEADQRLSTFQQTEERRCQLEADNESLELQLQQHEDRFLASKAEVERLRQSSADYAQDAQACREREAELLAYTQQLTDKVVRLQSESSATQARAQQMEAEREPLARQVAELGTKLAATEAALTREKATRLEESQLLARRLAEKQEWGERVAAQLEEAQGECAVLKRKQAQATKELTRELQQCRKKLDQFEGSGSLSRNSRASSFTSLNTLEGAATPARQQHPSNAQAVSGLDPQMLIEHIGKLQRKSARQAEKIEFLEEHGRTLVAEVQRKARLVQGLVLREEAGALSSRASDRSKAELVRHGGVMASVYSSTQTDEGMTLELSLEINRKLQAVLEDTLLKNITLKENMDTLGQEIERLSAQLSTSKRTKSVIP